MSDIAQAFVLGGAVFSLMLLDVGAVVWLGWKMITNNGIVGA